jgi:DNA-binding SARP family transcriptional activator
MYGIPTMAERERDRYCYSVPDRIARLAGLLHEAIRIAEIGRHDVVLRQLREARASLQGPSGPIQVDLLAGRVLDRGVPVAFSPAELAVVIALALNNRGTSRELLAEDLYPHADPVDAANTLRVNVHRVRHRIGSKDLIRYDAGRYVLGDAVDVELVRFEGELRHIPLDRPLTTEQVAALGLVRHRVLAGRPEFVLAWPWFDEAERRLRELGRDLTLILARDALRKKCNERAIDLAMELVHEDPLDEVSSEFALRALLDTGNRTAAGLEYHRYAFAAGADKRHFAQL